MWDKIRHLITLIVVFSIISFAIPAQTAGPSVGTPPNHIGTATVVIGTATATRGAQTRRLVRGSKVFQDEWLETASASLVQVRFLDKTVTTVGPETELVLDSFAYDTQSTKGKVLLEMTRGVMRFVTGILSPKAYRITTPTATIGIRGTVFDVVVNPQTGATSAVLHKGEIVVHNLVGMEQAIKTPGFASMVSSRRAIPSKPIAPPLDIRKRVQGMSSLIPPPPTNPPPGSKPFDVHNPDPTFIQGMGGGPVSESPVVVAPGGKLRARISVPYDGALVRANVPIFGLAYGEEFVEYRIEYGEGTKPGKWITIGASTTPQMKDDVTADLADSADISIKGNLATWDTGLKNYVYLPSHPRDHPIDLKGTYTVRLVVRGKDGSTVEDRVTVDVANVIPNAWGGQSVSKDGKVTLEVPEQALWDTFRLISISAAGKAPAFDLPGRRRIGAIYATGEAGERFTKPAVLKMVFTDGDVEATRVLEQLGIYAYAGDKGQWEYLQSYRQEDAKAVFSPVRKLPRFLALATSELTGEGSALVTEDAAANRHVALTTPAANGRNIVENSFEGTTGHWSNRDNEAGAEVALDTTATFDGSQALKITNREAGGNFAVNVFSSPFDAREYPVVQFDYRIPAGVKTNFLVKVGGRWYEIGFTDDFKELTDKRVNIAHIGAISDIDADDQWHTARFNLYDMLRTATGNTIVERMIMADWNVNGYMKLGFGHNPQGISYYIDNFTIGRELQAGLRADVPKLVVDNFNQKKESNALGGRVFEFHDPDGRAGLETAFAEQDVARQGHALRLAYDDGNGGGYAGYVTSLENLDLRDYRMLTLFIKGTLSAQDLIIGLKDGSDHESKVLAGDYIPGGVSRSWRKVAVPLAAFPGVADWAHVASLSLSFNDQLTQSGVILVDNVEFDASLGAFLVDDFERNDGRNRVGRGHLAFAKGAVAVNAVRTSNSPNAFYRLSYGGNIGDIKAYASGLFSYGGWITSLGGVDCSKCGTVSFRMRGAEGGERPNIYLGDGNFRWGVDVEKYAKVTSNWREVTIPLSDFAEYGVDLTHLDELQIVFEWERMSGTVYVDDIRFGPSPL